MFALSSSRVFELAPRHIHVHTNPFSVVQETPQQKSENVDDIKDVDGDVDEQVWHLYVTTFII